MNFNPVVLSIPLYFFLIGLELIWKTRKKRKVYRLNDAITNISCGISSQISNALWGVVSIGMYQFVFQYYALFTIPINAWSSIVLFLAVDFFYYWYHRASHEINFLWNTSHVVHHQSEDYNLSVALRQASFGGIFSMLFYLPLALLGFNTYVFLTVKGLNLIYQFWIHTESIKKMPTWFEALFNTPSHHRVHHGRNPKYIDRNHAGTLIIWDKMFGTFQKEEEKPTYGVTQPINSWNPLWVNVQPIVKMMVTFWNTRGFIDKLKILFFKPGWKPQAQGGYQPAPKLIHPIKKYDITAKHKLHFYLIVQYVVILTLTAFFLFNLDAFGLQLKLIFSIYILFSITCLGLILERKKLWNGMEIFRNLLLPLGCYLFFPQIFAMVLMSVLGLTAWFLFLTK